MDLLRENVYRLSFEDAQVIANNKDNYGHITYIIGNLFTQYTR